MAGFDAPGAGPGGLDPSRPPAAYTPVYAFHEPFAWSTARLLQARRAWSRATCARSHAGSSHAGRAGVFVPQDRQRRRARLQAPDALFPDTQVGALVGAWVVGSLALVLLIRLFLRAVCPHVEPLSAFALGHLVPSCSTHSPILVPPTQRASRGHKSVAAAVSASVKERAVLFAASPHEWCAHTRPWGSRAKVVSSSALTPCPASAPPQGGTQRVAAPGADMLRVPRSAGGDGGACAGVLLLRLLGVHKWPTR